MTGYLVDTNIPSELTRDQPDSRVAEFLRTAGKENLFLSVMTIGEICKCIDLLPLSQKRNRTDRLSEADIRQLLGFETRMEVHVFLKEHGAFMHYTLEDLEHDSSVAIDVARGHQSQQQKSEPSTELHAG